MTSRIDTLIQRAAALGLAAAVTLAIFVSIDGLAGRDNVPDALLVQQAVSQTV